MNRVQKEKSEVARMGKMKILSYAPRHPAQRIRRDGRISHDAGSIRRRRRHYVARLTLKVSSTPGWTVPISLRSKLESLDYIKDVLLTVGCFGATWLSGLVAARPTSHDADTGRERPPRAGKDPAANRFPTSSDERWNWSEAYTCCSRAARGSLWIPEPGRQAALPSARH